MKTIKSMAIGTALMMAAGFACEDEGSLADPTVETTSLHRSPEFTNKVGPPPVDGRLKALESEVADLQDKVRADEELRPIFGVRVKVLRTQVEDARVEVDGLKRSHKPVNPHIERKLEKAVAQIRARLEQIRDRVDA